VLLEDKLNKATFAKLREKRRDRINRDVFASHLILLGSLEIISKTE
jgi:hypothetical protein